MSAKPSGRTLKRRSGAQLASLRLEYRSSLGLQKLGIRPERVEG